MAGRVAVIVRALLCHLVQFIIANSDIREPNRQAKTFPEPFQRSNAGQRGFFRIEEIGLDAPNTRGKLAESRNVMFVHIFHPCRENDAQTSTMSDIVHAAQFVLDVVRGPVAYSPGVQKVVVRNRTSPHQLRPGVVILLVYLEFWRRFYDRAQVCFDQPVGHLDMSDIGKIALHKVSHNVRNAIDDLIVRQCKSEFRVED